MVVEVKDFTHGESAEKKSRFRPKFQGFFSEIKFSVLCRLCEAEVTSRLFPPCCTEIKKRPMAIAIGRGEKQSDGAEEIRTLDPHVANVVL